MSENKILHPDIDYHFKEVDMSDDISMEELHRRSVNMVENTLPVINDASRIASDIRRWGHQTKNPQLVSMADYIDIALRTAWEALLATHRIVETSGSRNAGQEAAIAKYLHEIECLARELEKITLAIEYGDVQEYIYHLTAVDNYNVTNRLISLIAGSLAESPVKAELPSEDEVNAFKALIQAIMTTIENR